MTVHVDIACIDELLGPKARAKGVRCPCAKCSDKWQVKSGKPEIPAPSTQHPVPDHKMRAAHDDTDN